MFHIYWPVIALVAGVILVAVILSLSMVAKLCGARNTALPDRDLKTYLPDHIDDEDDEFEGVGGGEAYPPLEAVDIMMQPQGVQAVGYEPGIPYHLDASMSPEGRREFEI